MVVHAFVSVPWAGIAQLIQCSTEKPGTILTQIRLPREAKDFVSQSPLSVQTLTVSIQPSCTITCMNSCMHVKNPKH